MPDYANDPSHSGCSADMRGAGRERGRKEYREWIAEHRSERLPHTKQRGLFPCFVWGGVGHNKKTELYFLEAKETLTADLYLRILQETLIPAKRQYPRSLFGSRTTMHNITMDNDSKHYNDASRAFFRQNKIELVGCHRHDVRGQPDRAPGPGGALQEQVFPDKFPPYRCVGVKNASELTCSV